MQLFRRRKKEEEYYQLITPNWIEQAEGYAQILNTTTRPKEFFDTYELLLQRLENLATADAYCQHGFQMDSYKNERGAVIDAFIDRSYQAALLQAADKPTLAQRGKCIEQYFDAMLSHRAQMTQSHVERINKEKHAYEMEKDSVAQEQENWPLYMLQQQTEQKKRADALDSVGDGATSPLEKGVAFERYMVELLRANGYEDVEATQQTRESGIDVLASLGGARYGIQCKYQQSNVGNQAVQEVYSGKDIHHCHVGVVATNSYFTSQAHMEAAELKVMLWDRDALLAMQRPAAEHTQQASVPSIQELVRAEKDPLLYQVLMLAMREGGTSIVEIQKELEIGARRAEKLAKKVEKMSDGGLHISRSRTAATTDEELQAFGIVQGLLHEVVDPERLSYKRRQNYFVIQYDDSNWNWICRLKLDGRKRWIDLPGGVVSRHSNGVRIPIHSLYDLYEHKSDLIKSVKRLLE